MLARHDVVLVSLTDDGRLVSARPFDLFQQRLRAATDCFIFCHGWLTEHTEARDGAQRFFGHLDSALRPLGERVVAAPRGDSLALEAVRGSGSRA